jgi:hypothetical protein
MLTGQKSYVIEIEEIEEVGITVTELRLTNHGDSLRNLVSHGRDAVTIK